METSPKAKEAVEWYAKNRHIYAALAKKVESIIREILDVNKINYYNIGNRGKTLRSYEEKVSKEQYKRSTF